MKHTFYGGIVNREQTCYLNEAKMNLYWEYFIYIFSWLLFYFCSKYENYEMEQTNILLQKHLSLSTNWKNEIVYTEYS